ncbi:MAG: histidine kinase [Verrucomicrobiaceae bacterium]|nr:histidine kinase [Verrucomicrobiaceae bacterium]
MSALIDDVLDFARGRLGSGIGVQIQAVDDVDNVLSAVVTELQDAHAERIIDSNIVVNCAVDCDKGRLQQLASNLLANALTHGSAHSPVVFTSTTNSETLIIDVWNDGEPIPSDSIDKIFAPFWRRSTSAQREGLGLGLHICAEIVSAHKGQLFVTSTRESGTRFTAQLPLHTISP